MKKKRKHKRKIKRTLARNITRRAKARGEELKDSPHFKHKHKSKRKPEHKRRLHFTKGIRPVVISKATSDEFLNLPAKDRTNTEALFWFYCYTAAWQKTNQPHATDEYVSGVVEEGGERNGLGWDRGKVARYRKILQGMGRIERLIDGVTGKTYIKINFYHHNEVIQDALLRNVTEVIIGFQVRNQDKEIRLLRGLLLKALDKGYVFTEDEKSQIEKAKRGVTLIKWEPKVLKPIAGATVKKSNKSKIANSGKTRPDFNKSKIVNSGKVNSGFPDTNAYRANTQNAYKDNTVVDESTTERSSTSSRMGSKVSKFDKLSASKLHKALQVKKKIYRKVNKRQWILQFKKLRIDDGVKKKDIKEVLSWYIRHIGEEFVPQAYSAKSFREKFDQIFAAMEQGNKGKGEPEDFPVRIIKKTDDEEVFEIDYGRIDN